MSEYDPTPDAIDFLTFKTPIERHAIARLLDVDGTALAVLRWIVDRPDCDRATAAMIFWRLRGLPARSPDADFSARTATLEAIAANARAGRYAMAKIAWDGLEVWERTALVGATRIDDVTMSDALIPPDFFAPFGTATAEPATHAFFEHAYDADDIFDSLWRTAPVYAAAADWLTGKSAELWMAAVDEMAGSHPDEIYEWMVRQPKCPSSVAGKIFWQDIPLFDAEQQLQGQESFKDRTMIERVLARWRAGSFAPCDLDFSRYSRATAYRAMLARFPGRSDPLNIPLDLLDPPRGRAPALVRLHDDFDFWCVSVSLGNVVPRERNAAIAAWEAGKAELTLRLKREQERADEAAAPPSVLERLFYGGKFTGAKAQVDRCWRQFNVVMAAGAIILVVLMRSRVPLMVPFAAFVILVVVLSVYQSSAKMGGARRIIAWWTIAFIVSVALAFVFRWIDKGVIT